jgi:hypothetical protein
VKQLLEQAEAAVGSQRGDQLPEELRQWETWLAKIKLARKVVKQRAREKAAAEGKNAGEVKAAVSRRRSEQQDPNGDQTILRLPHLRSHAL